MSVRARQRLSYARPVRRGGEGLDAAAAFTAALLAGAAVLMPIRFPWMSEASPFETQRLLLGAPEAAMVGVIAAVAVGAVVVTDNRAVTAWWTAAAGLLGIFANSAFGHGAESSVTMNYVDALCAGVVLGAVGAAALRRPMSAVAFALGVAAVLVIGNSATPVPGLDHALWGDIAPFSLVAAPPLWFIAMALVLALCSGYRNRRAGLAPTPPTELPLSPILATVFLALVALVVSERLARMRFDAGVGQIGFAVAAIVVAATVAAFVLPGRDGVVILMALALTAACAAQGAMPRPPWSVPLLIAVLSIGLFAGIRRPSVAGAMTLVTALAAVSIWIDSGGPLLAAAAGGALAFIVGYCCGTVRPVSARSRILAAPILFLPSVVTALPAEIHCGLLGFEPSSTATPGWTAVATTLAAIGGIIVLYRLRPARSR
ncbi:hypothetical protein HLB23_17175 [Nocardia uniformis]|uniref:NocH n=1 Tax=Nocardia uniformis TaxID=53432 RepID=A0A849C1M7_9NOCA|nr:hypothetical protein [Nocardia uniformis]NNH71578.1 hypothetical protein [Nocardia uniformis]